MLSSVVQPVTQCMSASTVTFGSARSSSYESVTGSPRDPRARGPSSARRTTGSARSAGRATSSRAAGPAGSGCDLRWIVLREQRHLGPSSGPELAPGVQRAPDALVVDVEVRDHPDLAGGSRRRRGPPAVRSSRAAASPRLRCRPGPCSFQPARGPPSPAGARRSPPPAGGRVPGPRGGASASSSAIRPAAATIPAWRQAPRTGSSGAGPLRHVGPQRTEPTGAPRPFERQNIIVRIRPRSRTRRRPPRRPR